MANLIDVGFSEFIEQSVQEVTSTMKWMESREFKYATSLSEVADFIDTAIKTGKCAVDLETTGLSTRVKNGVPVRKIVGVALSYDSKLGIYIPINHVEDSHLNLNQPEILGEVQRLCSNALTIYHNAKFDVQFLRNYGVKITDPNLVDDTLILAHLYDSGRKGNGLKELSKDYLDQPMIELETITGKSFRFDLISPKIGYKYAAVDPACTLDLYNFFMSKDIIKNQQTIHSLEKSTLFAVMKMESNLVKIDVPYLKNLKGKAEIRIKEIEMEIFALAGEEFNLGSTQQLGKILFEKLKYPSPGKTASGQYMTDNTTLEKLAGVYPVIKKIVEFRGLEKCLNTYINNLLTNCDENDCIKLSFNQNGTDTGRFSSPGGQGIDIDGYSAFNVQSTPKAPDESMPWLEMRKAFIPRPGKTLVAADFENEEMRVATNLSNETVWINAVNSGVDFHTATAAAIYNKPSDQITKAERKMGKTTNFLALYLGGPQTLSEQAKISLSEAKKVLAAYFQGVPRLKKWMDEVIKKAKKEKFVKTSFGRIRPLGQYFNGDIGSEKHGERCAVNSKIQGVCADIMKAVMVKIYNWIIGNGLEEDVKMLMTMHDELVFEITTEKLELLVPEIARMMMLSDIITRQLKWPIPLTVDVKYGSSWGGKNTFFEDFPHTKKRLNEPPLDLTKPLEPAVAKPVEPEMKKEDPATLTKEEHRPEIIQPASEPVPGAPPQEAVYASVVTEGKYFTYTIKNRDSVTLRWLNNILDFLVREAKKPGNNAYGTKKILKLADSDGNLFLIDEIEVPIEAFLVLSRYHNI